MSRTRILRSARKEFADKGFDGSRVDRIAKAAKVNKAMLYYHFGSKEKLYEAVLDELLERIGAFLGRVLSRPAEPESVLREIAEFYLDLFDSVEELRPILLREMAGGGTHIRGRFASMVAEAGATQKFGDLIGRGIKDGSLRALDPAHTFVSFAGMNLFYLLFAPLLNSIWEIEDERAFRRARPNAVVDLFLDGIRTK